MNIKNLLLGPTRAEVKIVGTSFRSSVVARLTKGASVIVSHEPTNRYDTNAMLITLDGEAVGYIPKTIAERIIKETPDRSFLAHIASTTFYGNETIGGVVVFDSVISAPVTVVGGGDVVGASTRPPVYDRPMF